MAKVVLPDGGNKGNPRRIRRPCDNDSHFHYKDLPVPWPTENTHDRLGFSRTFSLEIFILSTRPIRIGMTLGGRSSTFVLGPLAGLELGAFVPHPPPVVILDQAVASGHAPWLEQIHQSCGHPSPRTLILSGGEGCKTLAKLEEVYGWLAECGLRRDGVIVGIGGGAVLDLAGMAAATWCRGVGFVSVPTTLLAMVDASIGGKTAVNAAGLKNPVGCFHPASGILADPGFLSSLPRSAWRDGLAELIKTAAIGDPELFREMHDARPRLFTLFAGPDADRPVPGVLGSLDWTSWIGRAASVKARIVTRDFQEGGLRRSLNLGHTLGHALEAISHRSGPPLSHGQAVAIGMAVVFRVAAQRGDCPLPAAVQMVELLEACGLPVSHPAPDPAELERMLQGDKKQTSRQGLNWVLPRGLGQMNIFGQVRTEEILRWLD